MSRFETFRSSDNIVQRGSPLILEVSHDHIDVFYRLEYEVFLTSCFIRVSDSAAILVIIGVFQGIPKILLSQVDTSYKTRTFARLKKGGGDVDTSPYSLDCTASLSL